MKSYTAVDNYGAALQLASTLAEIIKNPKAISDANEEFLKASQLSAERLKEVEVAQTTLDENKRISDQLSKDKQDFKDYVETSNLQIEKRFHELEQNENALMEARKAHAVTVSQFEDTRKIVDADIKTRSDVLADAVAQHKDAVASHLAATSAFAKREAKVSAKEKALDEALKKIAAQKQRLADAAKDD